MMQDNLQDILKTKGCVYMATSPINKKYIGITNNFRRRKQEHIRNAKAGITNTLYQAMRKYGYESFVWEILEDKIECNKLDCLERKYIAMYDTYKHGYNMTHGGTIASNDKEIIIERVSKICKPVNVFNAKDLSFVGTWQIKADIERELGVYARSITAAVKGQYKKPGGYYFTEDSVEDTLLHRNEIIQHINTKASGRSWKFSKEGRNNLALAKGSKVVQVTICGLFVGDFINRAEIEEITGIGRWSILNILHGGKNNTNFEFRYLNI